MMLTTALVAISLIATGTLAQTGCNDAVRQKCTTGTSSVCKTDVCSGSTTGNSDFKNAVLKIHNDLRKQQYTDGSYGADMMVLEWDEELANGAMGQAQTVCTNWDATQELKHDSYECRRTASYSFVGQNLAWRAGSDYANDTFSAIDSVQAWYNEIKDSPASSMFPYSSNPPAGHYTQVVWSRSYRLGCALVKRPSVEYGTSVWVACNYAPGGNMGGMDYNVFNPSGEVASACRASSAKDSASGLCKVTDEAGYRSSVGLEYTPSN